MYNIARKYSIFKHLYIYGSDVKSCNPFKNSYIYNLKKKLIFFIHTTQKYVMNNIETPVATVKK